MTGGTLRAGGCIRFPDAGPAWHTNASHATTGIDQESLRINPAGDLEFDLCGSAPVIAAIANPDETLVVRGIAAGISGGVNLVQVRFHKQGHGRINLNRDYHLLAGPYANLWLAIFTPDGPEVV